MNSSAGGRSSGAPISSRNRRVSSGFTRSLWNSLQSYLVVCLVLTSLFFIAAAALAQQVSVIFGIIGLWVILLDWAPTTGLLRRIGRTLVVSAKGNYETESDRVPVLLRIGGAALVLWAIATGILPQEPESAVPHSPALDAITR
jgi:hypothetical protein